MRIIYDFGANNGDDIPYSLKRSDLVVAVEAIPALADRIRERFHLEINSGRLAILNCVLSDIAIDGPVPFYVHKAEHYRSQFPRLTDAELMHFDQIVMISHRASDIIRHFGDPYYVKIDIEGYDNAILKDLFVSGIRPELISAESHHIDVFSTLVSLGGYRAFKLVDGPGVSVRYQNYVINTLHGVERYSFPTHWSLRRRYIRSLDFPG